MPTVTTFAALLSGSTWNGPGVSGRPTFVTYSFDIRPAGAFIGDFPSAFLASFRAFTPAEQTLARQVLSAWADVSGLTFFEAPPGQGDIRFGSYNFDLGPPEIRDTVGFAYTPAVFNAGTGSVEYAFGGDVFVDARHVTVGALLHEVGHALGLKHSFEGQVTLAPSVDDVAHTVMTYNTAGGAPTGLGSLDVEAIRFLYGAADADGAQAASWSWDASSAILTQRGGAGADTLAGVAVGDRISAGEGSDYVMARAGNDWIDGEGGNDTLVAGEGDDTIDGGLGADLLIGDGGDDVISGADGNDELWGLLGSDTLSGDAGDDTLHAGSSLSRLVGGTGDDVLITTGSASVDGGDGFDALWLSPTTGVSASLSYADLTRGGGSFTGIESVVLFGDLLADTLQGGALADVLVGAAGDDLLSGGVADDKLFGGAGADTLSGGSGADMLDGGAGDDLIAPGAGADDIWGGAGTDTVDYSGELSGVELTINAVRFIDGVRETMQGVENIVGTAFADIITGDAGDNRILGGAGSDLLRGGEGANYLRGDDGSDTLAGGAGFDDLNGNQGDDVASGGPGDDWVVGGRDNDSLSGDAGADLVYGNLGADTCEGGEGADTLRGGQDNDVLRGGAGADFLAGDRGDDTLVGGAGADLFHIFNDAGLDRVLDFNAAEGDRVMLAPGAAYTVGQVGDDTVIDLGGGTRMVLVGVTLSSLAEGWIFGA